MLEVGEGPQEVPCKVCLAKSDARECRKCLRKACLANSLPGPV